MLSPGKGQVTHALLTRPPLTYISLGFHISPFDLHVLSTPPAFILSQDRTLELKIFWENFPFWKARPFRSFLFSLFRRKNFASKKRSFLEVFLFLCSSCQSFIWHYCSRSFFRTLWKICFVLEFFRVALLFICQGSLCCCPVSRNSDILSPCPLHVNNFFYFFCFFFSAPVFTLIKKPRRFSRWSFIVTLIPLFVNMVFHFFTFSLILPM